MNHDFIVAYRDKLEESMAQMAASTGHGNASSWEDYKDRTGRVKGMRDALVIFDDLVARMVRDEHDAGDLLE